MPMHCDSLLVPLSLLGLLFLHQAVGQGRCVRVLFPSSGGLTARRSCPYDPRKKDCREFSSRDISQRLDGVRITEEDKSGEEGFSWHMLMVLLLLCRCT